MRFKIREFQEDDRDAVKALWETCGLTTSYNNPDEDIDRFLRFDNAKILVATSTNAATLIGTACLCHDAHRGYVYYLAVDPSQQGKGIGAHFILEAEKFTFEHGLIKMHVFVRDTNLPVVDFYERLGYKQQGVALMIKFLNHSAEK